MFDTQWSMKNREQKVQVSDTTMLGLDRQTEQQKNLKGFGV
jgi:hypothetical protein